MKRSLDIALRYGVAALAVGVALLVKLLLDPLTVQDTPFLLVFGAIIVSAWYGGLGPGLMATGISVLATDYFFLYPRGSFSGFGVEGIDVAVFLLEGVLVSVLTSSLRSARDRARRSTLEARSHRGESARERGALQADGRGGQRLRDLHAGSGRMRNDLERRRRAHRGLQRRGDPGPALLVLLPGRRLWSVDTPRMYCARRWRRAVTWRRG